MKRLYEPSAYGLDPDPGNYWQAVSPPAPERFPPVDGDIRVGAVVIGAGVTGLSAARRLAERGVETVVIDAAWPAWGASGRAGGFVCLGGAMLESAAMARRYGPEETRRFYGLQVRAVEEAGAFLDETGADVGRHSNGEWQLAHRRSRIGGLAEEAAQLEALTGLKATLQDRDALVERGLAGPEFHAGLHVPLGFAVDPRRYALALLADAENAGVRIHGGSPMLDIVEQDGAVTIETPQGRIIAERAIVATNGYGWDDAPEGLAARTMPVLSHVLATRPLTPDELAAQGWTSSDMAFDSRTLLHYFRLTPERRFIFGTRGGVSAASSALAASARRARRDFERMFPAWVQVETPHSWSGLVCLTASLTPFVGAVGDGARVFAALGYHGNGLAFGRLAGRMVADLAVGRGTDADIPAPMRGPLKRFALPGLRRVGLRAAYLGFGITDGWG